MSPCFVSSLPVGTARSATFGSSVCAPQVQGSSLAKRSTRSEVRMAAKGGENESITDWLYRKFMHNAIWDGDEQAGYEPFFKEAMEAREAEKQKAYAEEKQNGKN